MAVRCTRSFLAQNRERRDSTFDPDKQDDTMEFSPDADRPLDTQTATAESHTESHAENEAEAEDETGDDHENQQLSHEVSPIDAVFWDPNQITDQDFDASIPPFNGGPRRVHAYADPGHTHVHLMGYYSSSYVGESKFTVFSELQRLYNIVNSAGEDNKPPLIRHASIADDDDRAPSPNHVYDLLITLRLYLEEEQDADVVEVFRSV
ncbi:MAG: hypothetical protein M1831_000810 [Alyxoria varia]|nr:MAG: hypothetical protein M1831_000810 [Alyxoria varia]